MDDGHVDDGHELKISFLSTLFRDEDGKKSEGQKKQKEEVLCQIKQYVCALLNTRHGGKVILTASDHGVIDADDIIRPVEQFFQKLIDIDHLSKNMYISNQTSNQISYTVNEYHSLCTLNYNVYVATSTQLLLVTPLQIETIKRIIDVNRFEENAAISVGLSFIRGRPIGITESNTVQFKQLKTKKTGCNNLASRMINNKLFEYVSAFANHAGGCLYYGVEDTGLVRGEEVTKEDREAVLKKLQSVKNMKWPEHIGAPCQGKEWDIQFLEVIDEEGNAIPSTYVIVISIKSCPGGVFHKDPESYHIINGKVTEMIFDEWKQALLYPKDETQISRRMSQCDWSSTERKTYCDELDGTLLRLINNGDQDDFRKAVEEETHKMDTEVKLVILSKWYVFYYRQNDFHKAAKYLVEFKLNVPKVKDTLIFEIRGQLLESALERTRGESDNHKSGYEIAKGSLGKVDQISPCMLTVEFYVHFATMLTIIEGNKDLREDDKLKKALVKDNFKDEAILFYNKALEHLRETDYVPQSKADMEQKTHINLAILKLGCSLSGDVVDDVVKKDDIIAASTNLEVVAGTILKACNPLSNFRECHFKFAKSSLFYRRAQHETDPKRRIELLKSAKREVKNVGVLAKENKFNELSKYAKRHALVYEQEINKY